jgi:hypothetical protein
MKKTRSGLTLLLTVLMIPALFWLGHAMELGCFSDSLQVGRGLASTRAFYLAESGLQVAFRSFSASNYGSTTHDPDGTRANSGAGLLQPAVTSLNLRLSADGWYEWRSSWAGNSGIAGSDQEEFFRFQVYFPQPGMWKIVSLGGSAQVSETHILVGYLRGVLEYAFFDSGDLSEFVRGANQTITGKIHANGNLYLRPSGSTLQLNSDSVTAAGRIVRWEDAWGRADAGGTVKITAGNASGNLVVMNGLSQGYSGQGGAYDSYNPNWTKADSSGAMSQWGGVVRDSLLGVTAQNPPNFQSMAPGGYYQQHAGLTIDQSTVAGGWLCDRTLWNEAEQRFVAYKELDVAAMARAAAYPANGLIYSQCPVRLINAQVLPGPFTLVCTSTIYTQGHFNRAYPTAEAMASGVSSKQPAALITCDRIYHLSSGFQDSAAVGPPRAVQVPEYAGDAAGLLELNAALVDGAPTVSERPYVANYAGVNNPYYSSTAAASVTANSDNLLENWGGMTVRKRGSIVHLHNAKMAQFTNADAGPGITPWIVKSSYAAPNRDYGFDPDFMTKLPPYSPSSSQKFFWGRG